MVNGSGRDGAGARGAALSEGTGRPARKEHPRKASLEVRHRLVHGFGEGVVCANGLIAQGRGEAFDYLMGERTRPWARKAAEAAACALILAERPVISVNGNTAALCPKELAALSRACGAPLEVNLFYRTPERMAAVKKALSDAGARDVLAGEGRDEARIPELFSERRRVSKRGMLVADVVLVPLEDGDRAGALARMGKTVIAVDLNPLSVTARESRIAIVDNVVRALPLLASEVRRLKGRPERELRAKLARFDNDKARAQAIEGICAGLARMAGRMRE